LGGLVSLFFEQLDTCGDDCLAPLRQSGL